MPQHPHDNHISPPGPLTGSDTATAVEWDYARRVLSVFAFDSTDSLFWRVDADYAPLTFFVRCDDLFHWGTADLERVDRTDVSLLEQCADDVTQHGHPSWAGELFAARRRAMRPQGAFYDDIPHALHPLFDACGPHRTVGLTNPRPHPRDRPSPTDDRAD